MNKLRTPVNVNKETHLKLIVVLLCLAVVLAAISRYGVRAPRAVFDSHCAVEQSRTTDRQTAEKRKPAAGEPALPPTDTPAQTVKFAGSAQNPKSPGGVFPTEGLERPSCDRTEFLLVNAEGRYALLYDTAYRQAAWVAYLLTRSDVQSPGVKRADAFRRDPEVLRRGWPSASDDDYAGSPFDRGHLLPSADRRGTTGENRTTFYFSNISPQYPALNRRVWKNLEEQVRRWAERYDSLYVVTGPELIPGLERRPGGVGIPRRYFKAVLVFRAGDCRAMAFLLPNAPQIEGGFMDYALSVDELEAALGYDFFCRLPDSLENRAESRIDPAFWR